MAQGNTNIDDIIRKVKAALAIAGSTSNENVAATATATASRLIAKYNLDVSNFAEKSDETERMEGTYSATQTKQSWARYIWFGVAELNFCKYFYIRESHIPDRHTLIGTKINVLSCKIMAEYLVQTVEHLAQEAPIRGHDRPSFKLGCATRLQSRLLQLKAERAKGETQQTAEPGTTLPALANLYDIHMKENDEFYDVFHKKEKLKKGASVSAKNSNAFAQGYVAGGAISLNHQVDSKTPSKSIR